MGEAEGSVRQFWVSGGLSKSGTPPAGPFLVADRVYEGDDTRRLVLDLGYTPVVPLKSNRKHPCDYDREMYKRRNEVERLFRRLKGYSCVFSRYDKLDAIRRGASRSRRPPTGWGTVTGVNRSR